MPPASFTQKTRLQHSTTVIRVLSRLQAGCELPTRRIALKRCDTEILGGFEVPNMIICYNNYQGVPAELRNTILHELVHAYDSCRSSDMDVFNCKHLACTEVRQALPILSLTQRAALTPMPVA